MNEPITFKCPLCKAGLQLTPNENLEIKQARCPACRQWIKLPEATNGK